MSTAIKAGVFLMLLALVAVMAYVVWDRKYSRGARVDAAYAACMNQLGARAPSGGSTGKSALDASRPDGERSSSIGDAMASLRDKFGSAVCGAIKESCAKDFDGTICQAAVRRAT